MRHLLNTLYVTSEDVYLTLENEAVCVFRDDERIGRFPLINLESIICFSYKGASPALMGECVSRNINLAFCKPSGKFLARVCGEAHGNILLRKTQYRVSDSEAESCKIAKNMILGKIYNSRQVIARMRRDHGMRLDAEKLKEAEENLNNCINAAQQASDLDVLRGIEGEAGNIYFGVFGSLILNRLEGFEFLTRNRRPPLDIPNALLSFAYSMLTLDCASALETVGLDAYAGFMHRDRPGRRSLALDLMEEFRPIIADKFVLTLINNRKVAPKDFVFRENGAVRMNDEARKCFLAEWRNRKNDKITHPFLKEKLSWGLVPYVQSLLLARFLRGDLDGYPPFLWK